MDDTSPTKTSRPGFLKKGILSQFYFLCLLLLVAMSILILLVDNPYFSDMLLMTFFYAAMGLAWNIVGGFCGQLSLGHTVFFGIGGYTASLMLLRLGISPWIGMMAGAGISSIVGFLLGITTLRLRGPYFTLATLALGEIFVLLANYFENFTGGAVGLILPRAFSLSTLSFESKQSYGFVALGMMIMMFVVSHWIRNSKWGYFFSAIKDEEEAARAIGVCTSRYKVASFAISAFFTSIGGAFYCSYLHYADPDILFSIHHSIQFAMVAIIGGAGTVAGPILGAALITPLNSMLHSWLGGQMQGLGPLVYGAIVIFIVLFMPRGIVAWMRGLRRYFQKPIEKEGFQAKPLHQYAFTAGDRGTSDAIPLLDVERVKKSFGGLIALEEVRFNVYKNEIVGIIGPNGAGKTTLFNIISRSMPVDKGIVRFEGHEVTAIRDPSRMCSLGLARTFQIVKPFSSMNLLENVTVAAFNRHSSLNEARDYAASVVEFVGLGPTAHKEISSLTIADLKRLELAKALATKPKLLLLDEVMTGLTPTETDLLVKLLYRINEGNVTILLIEHVMRAIMTLSTRMLVLNYGRMIAEGSPEEIKMNPEVITAYLGKSRRAVHA